MTIPEPPTVAKLSTLRRDLTAGLVVFLVALPLCLGLALASNAPLFSGLIAGVVGGILVGFLSGSDTSVSGPAAGMTAIVAAQIIALGSYQTFLLAVVVAGVMQMLLGLARAGYFAAFVPTSVIKALLSAIGLILILKQIPHLLGHDPDPEGNMAFAQPDDKNTFTELLEILDLHAGAAVIGILSVALLVIWDRNKRLKKSALPAPLIVVVLGVWLSQLFRQFGEPWSIGSSHLVQVPVADSIVEFLTFLQFPDFSQWRNPKVYTGAMTIAAVASLETLLNIQAVDKIDPQQRTSPPNRELLAQGMGNVVSGLIGGLPITSVIARSSVNINAGEQTKLSTIFHGMLLFFSILLLGEWLNLIPLSCLAAILFITGIKLVNVKQIAKIWSGGKYQFVPFAITVAAIVLTDLVVGVLIGLAVSLSFILASNIRRPVRVIVEQHLGGNVVHIELANQVSFLNRASLSRILDEVPPHGHVLLDAEGTDYIDPDILDVIRDFSEQTAPARGIEVSLVGFRSKYQMHDQIQYVDYSTRDLQTAVSPSQVLEILMSGHERFKTGWRLTRDLGRQVAATAEGQHPLAVVLSCIDSRTPAELIFDLGVGDVFNIRIAGNVTSRKVLGSMEYACAVAGAKLIVVMGHTRCGAVSAATKLSCSKENPATATGCDHIEEIVIDIQKAIDLPDRSWWDKKTPAERQKIIDGIARRNVVRVVRTILAESRTLAKLLETGRIAIVGAMYDVATGNIEFLPDVAENLSLS